MNLERIFNILCVIASALIFLPFLLESSADVLPRWFWNGLTVLLVAAWGGVIVLYIMMKVRKRKAEKEAKKRR